MYDELRQAIRKKEVVLFVGAGVSASVNLPTYGALIRHLAEELDFDPDIYATHGDYLTLAEYYILQKGHIGPLRSWMERNWRPGRSLKSSQIHKYIVDLEFPIIYTTNYDSLLEDAFKIHGRDFTKIVSVADLTSIRNGATQIVKFHGDFSDDRSIVLSESSYFERLNFESPLDVKLRADLLGRSVLFIGYSLTDINIRYMLYRLSRQWEGVARGSARPKSYTFLTRPNPVFEAILEARNIHAIVSSKDDPSAGLKDFLKNLISER